MRAHLMNKIDSMWWHESPKNGPLASSHIAVLFCALVKNDMIVKSLLNLEFDGIPKNFSDRTLSPMDYCLAYTDGEIFDDYIKAKYRDVVTLLFDGNKIYDLLMDEQRMSHAISGEHAGYTLECNWQNVDSLADWLQQNMVTATYPTKTPQIKKSSDSRTLFTILFMVMLLIISIMTLTIK